MLDTNTVSQLIRGHPRVVERAISADMAVLKLSAITEAELRFGLARRPHAVKLHRALSRHAAPLDSLPTDLRDGVETTDRGRIVLTDALEATLCERTLQVFEPLFAAGRLRCLLLQLTPAFNPADHALDELELRHTGWLDREDATLDWFRAAGAAYVCVDAPRTDAPTAMPPVDAVTRDDLAFLRAHGRDAERYTRGRSAAERFDYAYTDAELDELADRVRALAKDAQHVECVLSNGAHALDAALV